MIYQDSNIPHIPKPTDPRFLDLTNDVYGRLTVIAYAGNAKKRTSWLCRCVCGKEVIVSGNTLRRKHSKSCGCLNAEQIKISKLIHGRYRDYLYTLWCNLIQRCTNSKTPQYSDYGGRGIKVSDDWRQSFVQFAQDVVQDIGERPDKYHSFDRIENNGNYERGNVRWAIKEVQANNTRRNRLLTFQDETLSLSQWAHRTGINPKTLSKRLHRGWSIETALTTPSLLKWNTRKGHIYSNAD